MARKKRTTAFIGSGIFVLMLAIALAAWALFGRDAPEPAPESQQHNVIIFAFDGLQARHLRAYGYELNSTPDLDRFLEESTLFERTVSPESWIASTARSIGISGRP